MNKPLYSKTRFAPTPSGFLHLGNIYSFAVTSALAKKCNAKVLLRIDDIDRDKQDKANVRDIIDTLYFLEIPYDEGPRNMDEYEEYSQFRRMGMYNATLEKLKDEGRVFACTCSRTDVQRINADHTYPGTCRHKNLPLDTPGACWRLITDEHKDLTIKTTGEHVHVTLPNSMRDFIVRRRDGLPGYQLTSLLDDVHYGIDLIVRGQDLWDSSVTQLYLSSVLGLDAFANTIFYHHPLLMAVDGGKLSKSGGATSVHYLRKEGKGKEDILKAVAEVAGVNIAPKNWEELINLVGSGLNYL